MEKTELKLPTGPASLNDVIILQKIDDDFDSLQEDFAKLKLKYPHKHIIKLLEKIKLRKKYPIPREVVEFYNKHKSSFDTITLSSTITDFLKKFYESDERKKAYNPLENFHQYFQAHPEEKENIRELLAKMKSLKIERIEINPNADFTAQEYSANTDDLWNETLTYLENIEVLPNYNSNFISYHSTESNYAIKLPFYGVFGKAVLSGREIMVTNLSFSPEQLPERLHVETFFRFLKEEREEADTSCKKVKDAVDLSLQELNMRDILDEARRILNSMSPDDLNPDLVDGIKTIQEGLEAFGIGIQSYDDSAIQQGNGVTKEILEGERKKQLTRVSRKRVSHDNRRV